MIIFLLIFKVILLIIFTIFLGYQNPGSVHHSYITLQYNTIRHTRTFILLTDIQGLEKNNMNVMQYSTFGCMLAALLLCKWLTLMYCTVFVLNHVGCISIRVYYMFCSGTVKTNDRWNSWNPDIQKMANRL